MKDDGGDGIKNHAVVSHEEWLAARTAFLAKEKEFTRLQEQHNQERRELPWEAVRKEYVFDGPNGKETLPQLFDGRSQLIVYHFMFEPNAEAGCPHCSLRADGFNGIGGHLKQRDVTMIVVSRALYSKLAAYQKRMGWNFKWVSSGVRISILTTTCRSRRTSLLRRTLSTTSRYKIRKPPSAKGTACSTRMRAARCFIVTRATTGETTR